MKILIVLMLSLMLTACGSNNANETTAELTNKENTNEATTELTNKEILNIEGHPTYFGSFSLAKSIWEPYKEERVRIDNQYKDGTILFINSYLEDEDIITGLEIYFKGYSGDSDAVSLNEALMLAQEYFPYKMIEENYNFQESYLITPENPESEDTYMHMIRYRNKTGKDKLPGEVVIYLEGQDESFVETLVFNTRAPKWTHFLKMNGFVQKSWDYDFLVDLKN